MTLVWTNRPIPRDAAKRIDRRKETDDGWWMTDGSGLADYVWDGGTAWQTLDSLIDAADAVPALIAHIRELEAGATDAESRWAVAVNDATKARAEVARLRGLLDAYMATVCACGHGRTSHSPADFGDCTECPHGTCGKYPGILWDLWHRDTLAEVQRLREEAATTATSTQELIAGRIDQAWAEVNDHDADWPFADGDTRYREGFLDGLECAERVARRPITEEGPR